MGGVASALVFLSLCQSPAPGSSPGPSPGPASVSDLRALEESIIATAARVMPGMVFIDGGSGVLITSDGYIVTNNHVIEGAVRANRRRGKSAGRTELTVQLIGGRPLKAGVVGRHPGPEGDIALLKTNDPGPFPHLELGDSDALRPGQWVLALGNPFLLGESAFVFSGPGDYSPSVSLGIVSALHRSSDMYPDAIQVDVAVNPGSSGGPLLNLDGKVVGINGKIQTRFLVEVNSGVGYAIPSNQIARFLGPLKRAEGGVVRRGEILGLSLAPRALAVLRVIAGSPGEKAGFLVGDRILAINGQKVPSRRRLDGLLSTYPAGSEVAVQVGRGEKTAELRTVLDPKAPGRLGVSCEQSREERGGVRVKALVSGGPAESAGVQIDDLILRFDGRRLQTVIDLFDAVGERRAGDTVELDIARGDRQEKLTVRLDAKQEE